MTRELAIKIIRGDTLGTSEQTDEAVKMAIGALKNEEVQLKSMIEYLHNTGWLQEHIKSVVGQQWIPCSERLPNEEERVLVCSDKGDIEISKGCAFDSTGEFEWYTSGWKFGTVLAWMPLPSPMRLENES